MKKLTKIKLIHWHLFENHTFFIQGNTLITGENGHGKSTLLDAIHYVLSGGSTKFNEAANNKNNRSLESYVRGKIGYEGESNLRDQTDVISYIVLEFYDEEKKRYSLLGTYIEIPFKSAKHGTFFNIENSVLEESFFIRDNTVLRLKEAEIEVSAKGKSLVSKKTLGEAKMMVKSVLGVDKKYFDLLPKALAFKPIDRTVNQFVYDFLLDDATVDIGRLKSDFRSYNEIKKMLKQEKDKLNALLPIEEKNQSYQQCLLDLDLLDIIYHEVTKLKWVQDLESSLYRKNQSEKDYNQQSKKIETNEIEYQAIEQELQELKTNDTVNQVNRLRDQLKSNQDKHSSLKNECKNKEQELKLEIDLAHSFGLKLPLEWPVDGSSFGQFLTNLPTYLSQQTSLKESIQNEQFTVQGEISLYSKRQKELNEKIEQLKKKDFQYPEPISRTIQILREEHQRRFGLATITIEPLCKLIEIKDIHEDWRNAIEELLNDRRFDLLIRSSFSDQDLKDIFVRNAINQRIHHSAMVLSTNATEIPIELGSFASMIETHHLDAKALIQHLFNGYFPVKSETELIVEGAVHSSGLLIQKNTLIQMDHNISKTPFIGQEAIKIQLEQANKELNDLLIKIKDSRRHEQELKDKHERLNKSKIMSFQYFSNRWAEIEEVAQKIEKIKGELSQWEKQSDWIAIEERMNRLTKLRVENKKTNQDLNIQLGAILERLKSAEDEVESRQTTLKTLVLNSRLEEVRDQHLEIYAETYRRYVTTPNHEYILRKIKDQLNILNPQKATLTEDLYKLMLNYVHLFDNGQLNPHIDSIPDFLYLLNQIRSRNLSEYEGKSEEAINKCYTSFKEDFISKLNASILEAEHLFDNLNKSLKTKPFGSEGDIYTFKYTSSGNPNFKSIYDLLKSGEDYIEKNLFVTALSSRNQGLLDELFAVLTGDENDEKLQAKIRDYTDYRKYMEYDIEVKNKNGKSYRLSKEYRAKSGGETQTPFYVIIAASFHQLTETRKNTSPASVVLFDEAFNNMDEMRIESMMNFYKELHIQLFIAVPTLRSKVILPHVDQTYGLMKINDVVRSVLYTKQKEEVKKLV